MIISDCVLWIRNVIVWIFQYVQIMIFVEFQTLIQSYWLGLHHCPSRQFLDFWKLFYYKKVIFILCIENLFGYNAQTCRAFSRGKLSLRYQWWDFCCQSLTSPFIFRREYRKNISFGAWQLKTNRPAVPKFADSTCLIDIENCFQSF